MSARWKVFLAIVAVLALAIFPGLRVGMWLWAFELREPSAEAIEMLKCARDNGGACLDDTWRGGDGAQGPCPGVCSVQASRFGYRRFVSNGEPAYLARGQLAPVYGSGRCPVC
jgi:hypothetical protein